MDHTLEDLAETLYIAPEGAMQFEIQRVRSRVFQALLDRAVWVRMVPEAQLGDQRCQCRPKWELIIAALDPEIQRAIYAVAPSPRIAVCGCVGRIIE